MGELRVYSGRNLLKLSGAKGGPFDPPERDHDQVQGGDTDSELPTRGNIRGLSSRSAYRLMQVLSCCTWGGTWWHVCLTYGPDYPMDKCSVDRDRRAITNRLNRLGLCAVWRLEFQKRGAPHWHLLIRNVDSADDALPDECSGVSALREWWATKYNPSAYGSFSGVRDMGKAGFYLACHHAKSDQGTWPEWFTGRAWGYIGKAEFLAAVEVREVASAISGFDVVWLHRIRRRFIRAKIREDRRKAIAKGKSPASIRKGRAWQNAGFTWFLPEVHHDALLRLCDSLAAISSERACRGSSVLCERSDVFIPSD